MSRTNQSLFPFKEDLEVCPTWTVTLRESHLLGRREELEKTPAPSSFLLRFFFFFPSENDVVSLGVAPTTSPTASLTSGADGSWTHPPTSVVTRLWLFFFPLFMLYQLLFFPPESSRGLPDPAPAGPSSSRPPGPKHRRVLPGREAGAQGVSSLQGFYFQGASLAM